MAKGKGREIRKPKKIKDKLNIFDKKGENKP